MAKKARKTKKTRVTKKSVNPRQGKVLRAARGFSFRRRGRGVMLMRGGVGAVEFNCECSLSGGCKVTIEGQTATCLESGCSGSCGWIVKVPGIVGLAGIKVRL